MENNVSWTVACITAGQEYIYFMQLLQNPFLYLTQIVGLYTWSGKPYVTETWGI